MHIVSHRDEAPVGRGAAAARPKLSTDTSPSMCSAPGARGRVLVVEDDSPIRVMLSDLLQDAGFGVLQAGDGYEALEHLRACRPDLIVLDLMLPRMSGWKFLDHARAAVHQAEVPIVVLSAIKGESEYPNMLGVAEWLTKPLQVDRFLGAIERLAHNSQRGGSVGGSTDKTEKRVLIVEDEQLIRNLLSEHLSSEGYATELAGTIAEAQARISANPPSIIVLDLMLPGRSGWDFLRERQIDSALAKIPVVVISAAPQDRILEAKELGATAFLSKPFDLEPLSALINTYVS